MKVKTFSEFARELEGRLKEDPLLLVADCRWQPTQIRSILPERNMALATSLTEAQAEEVARDLGYSVVQTPKRDAIHKEHYIPSREGAPGKYQTIHKPGAGVALTLRTTDRPYTAGFFSGAHFSHEEGAIGITYEGSRDAQEELGSIAISSQFMTQAGGRIEDSYERGLELAEKGRELYKQFDDPENVKGLRTEEWLIWERTLGSKKGDPRSIRYVTEAMRKRMFTLETLDLMREVEKRGGEGFYFFGKSDQVIARSDETSS